MPKTPWLLRLDGPVPLRPPTRCLSGHPGRGDLLRKLDNGFDALIQRVTAAGVLVLMIRAGVVEYRYTKFQAHNWALAREWATHLGSSSNTAENGITPRT